jgi:hypothetical protein
MPHHLLARVGLSGDHRERTPRTASSAGLKAIAQILLVLLLFIACPSPAPAKSVLPDTVQAHIENVEVAVPADAPPAFAESLKEALLKESSLYGTGGRPLTLKVDVRKVHFKGGVGVLFGDYDVLEGRVTVVDPATGQPQGDFKVEAGSKAPSSGGSALLGVLSIFDPTGLIGMGQAVSKMGGGHAKAAFFMCANFSKYALKQTFGSKKAKTAAAARRRNAQAAAAEAKQGRSRAGTSAVAATPPQAPAAAAPHEPAASTSADPDPSAPPVSPAEPASQPQFARIP